jgi:hypothetical protein
MKAFIRKLSIKERKGFLNSMIYSLFSFINLLLTKLILNHGKISYITLIFISGSLLTMMSIYRIFRLMKKFKSNKKENLKINFIVGAISFLSYFFLTTSVDTTSLTNIVFISRIYPFLLMMNRILTDNASISSQKIISFLIYIVSFLIIFFPALYRESGFGVLFCLISVILKFSSFKYLTKAKGINIDLLMLNIGFFNAFFGGMIVITTFDKVESVGKLKWILIILNAFMTYYMKIFINKVLKGDANEQKLLIFNVLSLIFAFPIDYFSFGQTFYYNYLVLIFSFIEIFFFYKKIKKVIKSDAIYP